MQKLERTTFEVSRELEFFTEKELQMQIGHGRELWPVALLKELIDNALDACETANVVPLVVVEIGDNAFGVHDNGPGLPAETLVRSLDYMKRVSDKAFYVSPTRGQLGNALKVLWAAPFVAHGEHGRVEVWSHGLHHMVDVSVDRIAQRPELNYKKKEDGFVKNGTFVKIHWPNLACSIETEDEDFYITTDFPTLARELVEGYAAFNPHASFRIGDATFEATDPTWKKWKPDDPTSPHWYRPETIRDLIAAYVSQEKEGGRARTVREFVSEFRGLSSTAKQKQALKNLKGIYLHDLVSDRDIDMARVERLLEAMKTLSSLPKPVALGVIGQDHLEDWMVRYANVSERSIRYKKKIGINGLPHVLEVAFGIHNEGERRIVTGLNWSPTLVLPTEELSNLLGQMRIDADDPVTVVVHIARPRFEFVDRGKTRMELISQLKNDLASTIRSVAKDWKKAKRRADKQDRVSSSDLNRMRNRPQRTTIRDVAFQAMEDAYMKASGNGRYPANARQIYYAARPVILDETGEHKLDSQYFTQTLLKDYMDEYRPAWDVVYDARGHITEPHTGEVIGLGGLEVRQYIGHFTDGKFNETPEQSPQETILTRGPGLRYGAVLFVEKEGFDPLLKAAKIAERFDVAIASTKGMPVSALCDLLSTLKRQGRKVYVVHDFDKSGFSIVATLRKGARGSQGTGEVVDMGFRLEDIEGLEREQVTYRGDPRWNLRRNGAAKEEIEILVGGGHEWEGERVELNAMASDQFIEWLERKLREHGIKKLIPESDTLAAAYRRAVFLQRLEEEEEKLRDEISKESISVPDELEGMVRKALEEKPERSWDQAIWRIANWDVEMESET